ncbi:MAG TPA: L,D-transpeptidase family protein [Streptosporangiaceae bacterium]
MRPSVWRWLCCAGAVTAVGASACLQAGQASAARVSLAGHNAPTAQTAPATTYVPPTTNLKFGDHGPAVRSVQKRLNQLGYYAGPADGQYGNDLEEAVWAFKEVQGLPINGGSSVITRAFRHALINPRLPKALVPKGGPGRVEVNQSIQVLVLYRHNQPHLILHISSGGRYYFCDPPPHQASCGYAITPDGNYKALWYYKGTLTVPLGYMENPVFFIGSAYAIHGGDAVPWYPASHGCIRIYDDVVTWFHTLVSLGTTHIYVRGKAPQYLS